MQSHARRVHPANSAEVISDVYLQMARFHNTRSGDPAQFFMQNHTVREMSPVYAFVSFSAPK